jgi:Polysulphide reductase, NrfD
MDRESRLDDLRREAKETGTVQAPGVRPAGAPFPIADADHGYYGLPLLKRPTWTWEVPAYLFVGGTAGAAALIGAAANMSGHPTLARDARWIAAAGAAASPPLLISDLGRPDRFLNMLRVFKVQSPMSVGVWTLVAFSTASATAAFADVASRLLPASTPVRTVRNASELMAASTGIAMSTYTGVLIGATSIPVWSANVRLLPIHFAAGSLGGAASLLEIAGHRHRGLHLLALASAAVETAVAFDLERRTDRTSAPLREGESGALIRAGGILSGPVPLVLRLIGGRSFGWRRAAGLCAVAGALLSRFGWVRAGAASADDPDVAL